MKRNSVTAHIDLAALRHNLHQVRLKAPQARVMAVVKSLAYGHGAEAVAAALAAKVDALAVARIEEAQTLRSAGIVAPIVVLQGATEAAHLPLAAQADLQLTFHHASQLALLDAYQGAPLRCWLKLNTGMNRLGFPASQARQLVHQLQASPVVRELRLMTHLACADDRHDPATARQLHAFHAGLAGVSVERSIANSAGVLAWPETHADWVRPGLMLYGASPLLGESAASLELRPVMTLRAPLIAIQQLQAGDAVGYGGTWQAPEPMPLGVLGIGYGDGYPRHIGAGAQVLLNGQRVPLLGRVSMDSITVDLRGVSAQVGDQATLWGEGLPAEAVAGWADTIPYTLFCGVTERVARYYTD